MPSLEDGGSVNNEVDHTFPSAPQLPKQEQTAIWIDNCHKETTKRPLNPKVAEFVPRSGTNATTTLQAMQLVKFSGNAAT